MIDTGIHGYSYTGTDTENQYTLIDTGMDGGGGRQGHTDTGTDVYRTTQWNPPHFYTHSHPV